MKKLIIGILLLSSYGLAQGLTTNEKALVDVILKQQLAIEGLQRSKDYELNALYARLVQTEKANLDLWNYIENLHWDNSCKDKGGIIIPGWPRFVFATQKDLIPIKAGSGTFKSN